MPYERDYQTILRFDDGIAHILRVYFRQDHGEVFEYVVQYEVVINNRRYPVVRFDNAHGFPHRDLISPKGLQSKTPMPNLTNAEALSFATVHIRERFQEYFEWFQRELQKSQNRV